MRLSVDQLTLAAAVLATVVAAKPMSNKDVFTVHQVPVSTKSSRRSGPAALVHAYHRYGKKMPGSSKQKAVVTSHGIHRQKSVKAAAGSSAGDGSVAANPSDLSDNEYVSSVLVGGQKVYVDFDTGSSDFWVFSSELSSKLAGNHSIYNPSKSASSSKLAGASWNISYGDNSYASGNVYLETVNVGGAIAHKQAVELAEDVSDQFVQDYASGGLLGLGFDSINTVTPTPQKTFFTNVKPSLAQPLFTVDLNHNAAGSFDFGFIDAKKYSGEITYTPVDNSQGFWGVTSTSYGVGDSSNMVTKDISAIVDTGTSLLLVPEHVLKAYYKKVDGAKKSDQDQGYIFPCSTTLPDFYIGFGAYTAVVPGAAINNSAIDDTNCYGGIQFSDPSSGPEGIYGDVFLLSSFVVFKSPDGETPSVGFAAKGTGGAAKSDAASPADKKSGSSKKSHKSSHHSSSSGGDSSDTSDTSGNSEKSGDKEKS